MRTYGWTEHSSPSSSGVNSNPDPRYTRAAWSRTDMASVCVSTVIGVCALWLTSCTHSMVGRSTWRSLWMVVCVCVWVCVCVCVCVSVCVCLSLSLSLCALWEKTSHGLDHVYLQVMLHGGPVRAALSAATTRWGGMMMTGNAAVTNYGLKFHETCRYGPAVGAGDPSDGWKADRGCY